MNQAHEKKRMAALALAVGAMAWSLDLQALSGYDAATGQRTNHVAHGRKTGEAPWYAGIYHDSFSRAMKILLTRACQQEPCLSKWMIWFIAIA
ncbi:MAG: hypothetical protein ACYCVB_16260 [Bacilli bacterium]